MVSSPRSWWRWPPIMFGRLKDWRRVATRYDRCPQPFFFAVILAAIVLFWLGSRTSPEPTVAPR
ncbi:hypothetical protein CCR83_09685 [Rhodobacter veldkampii DSM 11550]|uniref:Transposase DDE domain-containing protein n=1 Tax=Phaeovulum veldkampii DSM 11550 TaxID=1185920 RepID=A0A2T4JBI6_9RHOB|nr:hypothetical protein [Phaeovulum veldkampii DSM 11550]PTE15187.1 hypothetical protein C5F46_14020 [Phaeovulum veldkampii DSM 11550]